MIDRDKIQPFDPPTPGDNLALLARTEPADPVRDAIREAYYDAARIVLEPRAGVAPYLARAIADRLVARAHGLAQPGAGAFPHERAFRVYTTGPSGVSTAVPSAPLLGRGGLLTLEEAMKLRAATPESWIGVSPSCAPHSILRMEG